MLALYPTVFHVFGTIIAREAIFNFYKNRAIDPLELTLILTHFKKYLSAETVFYLNRSLKIKFRFRLIRNITTAKKLPCFSKPEFSIKISI